MARTRGTSSKRKDLSAYSKIFNGFGLLMLSDDYERYLQDECDMRSSGQVNWVSRAYDDCEKFVPLLAHFGIDLTPESDLSQYDEIFYRLQLTENFVGVLKKTTDFNLNTSRLLTRLKLKFEGHNLERVPYRTKQLIKEETLKQCHDVLWICREFSFDEDKPNYSQSIWQKLVDANRLHLETGEVERKFFNELNEYQNSRGDGSPRYYSKVAMTILLAECFEDFGLECKKAQIHPNSKQTQKYTDHPTPIYDSAFAGLLIHFCEITDVIAVPSRLDNSLDDYRKILRRRVSLEIPRISKCISQNMGINEIEKVLEIIDTVKK